MLKRRHPPREQGAAIGDYINSHGWPDYDWDDPNIWDEDTGLFFKVSERRKPTVANDNAPMRKLKKAA